MKKDFLIKETLKTGIIIIGSYLITLIFIYFIYLVAAKATNANESLFLKDYNLNQLPFTISIIVTIYVFYKYFGSTYNYLIKRGYTRKKFIIYSLVMFVVLSIIMGTISEILEVYSNNLGSTTENFILSILYFLVAYLGYAVAMTLVGKYKSGWVIVAFLFGGAVFSILSNLKNFIMSFKTIIESIVSLLSKNGPDSINLMSGPTAIYTVEKNLRSLFITSIIYIVIYLIWFVLSNRYRAIRD